MGKWHKGRIRRFFREGKKKVDLQLKQLADSGRPLDISPVSYTHLDVYKRQAGYGDTDEPIAVKGT